jgi:hypothetical protein
LQEVVSIVRQPDILASVGEQAQDIAEPEIDLELRTARSVEVLSVNVPDFWFVHFSILKKVSLQATLSIVALNIGMVLLGGGWLWWLFKQEKQAMPNS